MTPLIEVMISFVQLFPVPDARALVRGEVPSRAGSPPVNISGQEIIPKNGIARVTARRCGELLVAQVKALALFAWAVRAQNGHYVKGANEIPIGRAITRLLASVPPEYYSARRDTLSTLRMFVMADMRDIFCKDPLDLLDHRVLVGAASVSSGGALWLHDNLRTPAFTCLAEVLNHHAVRDALSLESIGRVFDTVGRALADPMLSASVSTLLLHLLFKFALPLFPSQQGCPPGERTPRRALLVALMNIITYKLGALRTVIPRVLAAEAREAADVERDRTLAASQVKRIAAVAEFVSGAQRAAAQGDTNNARFMPVANTLQKGLLRGNVRVINAVERRTMRGFTSA